MATVTKAGIVRELQRLGLRKGDIVMCHSALSSFGKMAGGAGAVVDALLETVGREGTLLMPTLVGQRPYDFRKSPSNVGAITEEFRRRPGVVRSLNPCVPAAAFGPRAKEFTVGHHNAISPYIGSPYDLAARAGGYVLLLGVDQDRNTTLHCAEAAAQAPYLSTTEVPYVGRDGKVRTYRGILAAGPHRDFIGAEPKLRAAGVIRYGRIGGCVVRLMKAQEMIDACVAEIRKDPTFFLTKNEGYWDGVWQRGAVRAHRLATEETFKLITRTSAAGRNMQEVYWHVARAGVGGLEVDEVDGRDIIRLTNEELETLLKQVSARHLKISVVRSNVLTDLAFHAAVNAAKLLKAEAVIAPLTGPLASLKARAKEARQAKLKMLFENVSVSTGGSLHLMQALHPAAALAFNPANFAAAGELPFLAGFRKLKPHVGYLAIADASRLGASCVPGNGNGEVKELISILRCSSFKGYFSLGAAPSASLAFDEIADAFYRLLDAC